MIDEFPHSSMTSIEIEKYMRKVDCEKGRDHDVVELMLQHSENEAIGFGAFISTHKLDFQTTGDGRWIGLDMINYTSAQLYKLFKEKP